MHPTLRSDVLTFVSLASPPEVPEPGPARRPDPVRAVAVSTAAVNVTPPRDRPRHPATDVRHPALTCGFSSCWLAVDRRGDGAGPGGRAAAPPAGTGAMTERPAWHGGSRRAVLRLEVPLFSRRQPHAAAAKQVLDGPAELSAAGARAANDAPDGRPRGAGRLACR